jgi:hypothetical protein
VVVVVGAEVEAEEEEDATPTDPAE